GGRAVDFMVRGVRNETVRDFCRTLRNVGVGYYPNSSFVHLDARTSNAYWVDYAGPGQGPRYHPSDPPPRDVDEGAGEVPIELAQVAAIASADDGSGRGSGSPTTQKQAQVSARDSVRISKSSDSTGEARVFPGRD